MSNYCVHTLEEAFLKLCDGSLQKTNYTEPFIDDEAASSSSSYEAPRKSYPGKTRRIHILNIKNMLVCWNHPGLIFFLTIYPFIMIACVIFTLGGNFDHNQIGFVSDEFESLDACRSTDLVMADAANYSCQMNKLSCRFLDILKKDQFLVVSFF